LLLAITAQKQKTTVFWPLLGKDVEANNQMDFVGNEKKGRK